MKILNWFCNRVFFKGLSLLGAVIPLEWLPHGVRPILAYQAKLLSELKEYSTQIPENQGLIWVHVASAGELEQAWPIICVLLEKKHAVYLSYTSESAKSSAEKLFREKPNSFLIAHGFSPILSVHRWKAALTLMRTKAVLLIKYETWPDLLEAVENLKIPLILVATPCASSSQRFKTPLVNWFFVSQLKKIHSILTLNERSKQEFEALTKNGTNENPRILVSGDPRFERVLERKSKQLEPVALGFLGDSREWFLVGSAWPEEEKLVLEVFQNNRELRNKFKGIVFVPHEVNEASLHALGELIRSLNYSSILYSKLGEEKRGREKFSILVVDRLGILPELYRVAKLSMVGGGFGRGIHNTLEAACYFSPVLFGPNFYRFQEAKDLIELGAGRSVRNKEELNEAIEHYLLMGKSERTHLKEQVEKWFNQNKGASFQIVNELEKALAGAEQP